MTWFLGIDAGLTNVKTALFDVTGRETAVAVRTPDDVQPAREQEERDPIDLWETVCEAINETLAEGPVAPEEVVAVGVAGHGHGLYALDASGSPVRNGIKSTDSRAAGVVAEWAETGRLEAAAAITGYEPFVADPLSLLGWLKRHEPASYDAIETVLFCKDYLKYRLTDVVCTDEMEASVFFDLETSDYSSDLFAVLDLEECAGCLPELVPSWDVCGEVTPAAAERTGLAAGTPVASGLHDIGATALGSGVYEAGQAMLIVGTWGQSIAVRAGPGTGEGIPRRYLADSWLRYKGNRSAATCVEWFVDACCADWQAAADNRGMAPYELYNRKVASVAPGANGLVFHPYLHGSTEDPTARAGFYGLQANHTKADLLRGIYEGVAITQCERLVELAPPDGFSDVRLGGGGAKSQVWSDIFASVLDDEIVVTAGAEAGARGAAICAAVAAGQFADHESAVEDMVAVARRHQPERAAAETYRDLREIFEEARVAMGPVWERLRNVATEQDTHD